MVACHSVAGRTTERAGRNHHWQIRVSLVGTADERAGDLHGRRNTRNLRKRVTQLTTNKVSIPDSLLLDRNFVFKNFAQLNTATAPARARCFAISAEYATFAVTYWIHGKCSLFSELNLVNLRVENRRTSCRVISIHGYRRGVVAYLILTAYQSLTP